MEQKPDTGSGPAVKALDEQTDQQAQTAKQQIDRSVEQRRADIEALGELPDSAHKAALVAQAILGTKDCYEGKHYSVRRTRAGSIELYAGRLPNSAQQPVPLLVVDAKGQVSCTSAFNANHASQFEAMHTQLSQALLSNRTKSLASKSAPSSRRTERESR